MNQFYLTIQIGHMIGDNQYDYINQNSPGEKINYSYSKFKGYDFLECYKENRILVVNKQKNKQFKLIKPNFKTSYTLMDWIKKGVNKDQLDLLIKRFEVTKRIYSEYDENFRPINKSTSFTHFECYLFFSYFLLIENKRKFRLQNVNCLLKVNDILISNMKLLNHEEITFLSFCLRDELKIIDQIKSFLDD